MKTSANFFPAIFYLSFCFGSQVQAASTEGAFTTIPSPSQSPSHSYSYRIDTLEDLIWQLRRIDSLPTDINGIQVMDGYEVLNGGDAVVCRSKTGEINSIEMLDVFETKTVYLDNKTELGTAQLTANEKVLYALARLYSIDPVRAEQYLSIFGDFYRTTVFLENVELADIPDSSHFAVPKGCALEQIAIQISNISLPEGTRIIINKDLWSELDATNQAVLILHEIVYQEAIALGHTNSFRTRYYTGFICSEQPLKTTQIRYINSILKTVQLPYLAP